MKILNSDLLWMIENDRFDTVHYIYRIVLIPVRIREPVLIISTKKANYVCFVLAYNFITKFYVFVNGIKAFGLYSLFLKQAKSLILKYPVVVSAFSTAAL